MLKAALAYAALGRRVFPCNGKKPFLDAWQRLEVPTAEQVAQWWTQYPDANIGWIMGGPDRLVCLDADGSEGLASAGTLDLPETLRARSGSGKGGHFFFHVPAHLDITRIKNRKVAPGLDVKCENGQVIIAPSKHPSGGTYEWLNDAPIADLPEHVYDKIAADPEPTKAAGAQFERPEPLADRLRLAVELAETLPPAIEGQDGHGALLHATQEIYWRCALPRDKAFNVLTKVYNPRCKPPWKGRELIAQFNHKLDEAEKSGEPWGSRLNDIPMADMFVLEPAKITEDVKIATPSTIEWVRGPGIFAPLPPPKWVVPGLQIGPGRPTMVAGYGFSGKTLSAQAMALSFAAGRAIWNKFASAGGTVKHFDHEQGRYATLKRYQRLAYGLGITEEQINGRLAVASFPDINLTDKNARDAYCRECEGVDFCLLDSLRALTPSIDENDARIRKFIDILSPVSEKTGTAFEIIHHSGKGDGEHANVRGSSAIFDACGTVFEMKAIKGRPVAVTQIKGAAEAEGGAMAEFGLEISDVAKDNDARAGLRVVYVEPSAPVDKYEEQVKRVVDWVRDHSECSPERIYQNLKPGIGKGTVLKILKSLEGTKLVQKTGSDHEGIWSLAGGR